MAISGWLVQGVQGSAHAISKAGSLRMQSYRLLATYRSKRKDQPLLGRTEKTAFSKDLQRAAQRDGQQAQLQALQGYWHGQLAPGLKQAQSADGVAGDVATFVGRIDALVTAIDLSTEKRIERVVFYG